ncbi:MAG: DUF2281 domain-containing protein [Calditrichae bacterium]|nr:DUF2281 domain-containing protein [Calditrichota bacterium]MCB9088700.1 DUF2281 domain-containing protein [Calditrichia bacterium]
MDINDIGSKIKKLPRHLIPEVIDYIDFLLSKYGIDKPEKTDDGKSFKFDWAGGLSQLKKEYTAVELQHKSLDWR